jgi:hypothetical protein
MRKDGVGLYSDVGLNSEIKLKFNMLALLSSYIWIERTPRIPNQM